MGAGRPVAGSAGGGLDAFALVVGQVDHGLGKAQQDPTPDAALLDPGAAGSAAGPPGTGEEAADANGTEKEKEKPSVTREERLDTQLRSGNDGLQICGSYSFR